MVRGFAEVVACRVRERARPLLTTSNVPPPFESLDGVHIACIEAGSRHMTAVPLESFDLTRCANELAASIWTAYSGDIGGYLTEMGNSPLDTETISTAAQDRLRDLLLDFLRREVVGLVDEFPGLAPALSSQTP